MLFYMSITGLMLALLYGAWRWAILFYAVSGVIWIARMRLQRPLQQPMGLMTLGGTLFVFFPWPLAAFYWYYGRWRFRGSRFRVCPHENSSAGSASNVLGEFKSWKQAIFFAKGLALGRQLQIDVLDTHAHLIEPWIYYVVPNGKIYRLEEPKGMSEYDQGNWRRI